MGMKGPPDRRPALGDERVLVVEDEAIVAMLVEDELREAGAEVVGPAASVEGALRLIEAAAKDGGLSAAVLDINLRGRAVAPVADRLAALGVPFLFATGYGEGCDTGGHADARVLRKPFDPHALIDAVEALASVRKWHGTSPGAAFFERWPALAARGGDPATPALAGAEGAVGRGRSAGRGEPRRPRACAFCRGCGRGPGRAEAGGGAGDVRRAGGPTPGDRDGRAGGPRRRAGGVRAGCTGGNIGGVGAVSRRALEARLGRVVKALLHAGGLRFPTGPVEGWPEAELRRLGRMVEAGGAVQRAAWARLTDTDLGGSPLSGWARPRQMTASDSRG